jgi:hypothetical protein
MNTENHPDFAALMAALETFCDSEDTLFADEALATARAALAALHAAKCDCPACRAHAEAELLRAQQTDEFFRRLA